MLFGKRVIFLDIDGVLANCGHRLKYIRGEKKDYKKFYQEVSKDTPINEREFTANLAKSYKGEIVFVTGRPERAGIDTKQWLRKHYDLPENFTILMRKEGDHRKSPEVKADLVRYYLAAFKVKSYIAVDDNEENVQAMVDATHPGTRALGMLVKKENGNGVSI